MNMKIFSELWKSSLKAYPVFNAAFVTGRVGTGPMVWTREGPSFTDPQQTISKTFDSFYWNFKTHISGVINFREIFHFNRKHRDFIKHEVKNDNCSPWHPQMWETEDRIVGLTAVFSVGVAHESEFRASYKWCDMVC